MLYCTQLSSQVGRDVVYNEFIAAYGLTGVTRTPVIVPPDCNSLAFKTIEFILEAPPNNKLEVQPGLRNSCNVETA